jgi:quercetin dioxygenase-like cupin family protein
MMKVVRTGEVPDEDRGGYSIKRLITENIQGNPENMGFYLTTIPPGSSVRMHIHPKGLEFLVFLTKGTVSDGVRKVEVGPNDIVYLDPGEKHEISAGGEEARLIAIRCPNFPDDKVVV